MATIMTAIRLQDQVTPAIRSMSTAMNIVINTFESLQEVSSNAVNVAALQTAREELAKLEVTTRQIEEGLQQAEEKQQEFNNRIREGRDTAGGLWNKIKGIALTLGAGLGAKKVLELSDNLASTQARLAMIVDSQNTVAGLQDKIFASAQRSRGEYQATADAVAKLGLLAPDAFQSNDEIIGFMEQLNKQFVISGTSAENAKYALLQITQAMGSGVLRGEELNSVFENTPTVVQSIADYLDVPIGKIKDMAQDGEITATILKNALFHTADEVNAKFAMMPMTFGQIWTSIKNIAKRAFEPLLLQLSQIANSEKFQTFINNLIGAIQIASQVAGELFNIIVEIASFFSDNWSTIGPIVLGIAAAFVAYKTAVLIAHGITLAMNIAQKISSALKLAEATAAGIATAAQWGLNAALAACPLTWIIIGIMLIIAGIYIAVNAINNIAGTSISATGVICGAIMFLLSIVYNVFGAAWNFIVDVFVSIYNLVADVANFFANVFKDPINSICRLFFDMADFVLGILQALASAIDFIFGTKLAEGVQGWRDGLKGWVDETFGKGEEVIARISAEDYKLNRMDPFEAWDNGYQWGSDMEKKVKDMFNLDQYKNAPDSEIDYDNLLKNVGDINDNTKKTSDNLEISGEDLKYLRDIAERDVINRFTTAEIKVEMTNHNTINNNDDLDGVFDYMGEKLTETLQVAREGV